MDLIRLLALASMLWAQGTLDGEETPTDPLGSPTPSEPIEAPSWDGLMEV